MSRSGLVLPVFTPLPQHRQAPGSGRAALLNENRGLLNLALVWVLGEAGEQIWQQGNNLQAVRYAELALEVNQQFGDQDAEASVLLRLNAAMQGLGNYVGSLKPLTRWLKLREAQQHQAGIASAYNNHSSRVGEAVSDIL
jgi:hypothetical protein